MNSIQKVCFIFCSIGGLFIAGMLGYFGEHLPLRVVILGLAAGVITLFALFFVIEGWFKKHKEDL